MSDRPYVRVKSLVLRGVCLMRAEEISWMYSGAAAAVQPKAWRDFEEHLLPEERGNVLGAFYRRLQSQDTAVRDAAVRLHKWVTSHACKLYERERQ